MPKVVGIKFRKNPKTYYFEAGEHEYTLGGGVVVETARGTEYGNVAMLPTEVEKDKIVGTLKPILRLATEEDTAKVEKFESKYESTMRTCAELIEKSGLAMKLVDVEYTFDESKLIVNFSAEGRVDFRELVKKLASAFRIRIELRQIGARDECKMIGGLGPCGRVCCCNDYLNDYTHVSIKMAKNQNLSLSPTKISGLCGRLMCCLEYENAHYAETNKKMPKMGATVKTTDGREGTVAGLNQLKETVRLKIPDKDMFSFADVPLNEIVFKGRKPQEEKDDDGDGLVPEELKTLLE